ncbi:hypothetical protein N7523_008952 [Penicillium sp. IBT 18751x]|nr:hypothetical protein N7523_008952 [Penicillium sp. IBT 18751x]
MFGPLDRKDDGTLTGVSVIPRGKGILCYKPIDLEKGVFAKWHIIKESSGRLAVGNFCGNSKNDIVSISYNVKDYYQEKDPQVTLYKNEADRQPAKARIIGTVWGGEGMVYIPDPMNICGEPASKELIKVANFQISVEVYPPNSKVSVGNEQGIKVLYGSLADTDDELKALGGEPFPKKESLIKSGDSLSVNQNTGAIILRLVPLSSGDEKWTKAEDVPVQNTFVLSDVGLEAPKLEFIKVEKLWWGGDFKGDEFYNLTGFHFRFLESKQNIAHMQFWTAGPNVDCRLHDHSDKAFKELHTCLYQGSVENGNPEHFGGMWAPKQGDCYKSLDEVKQLQKEGKLEHCPLARLEEHGRIWHTDHYGQTIYRKNKTVSYPGHAWIAGLGPNIDVWMALEFDARLEL